MSLTRTEKIAIVDKERAELEDMYYRMDNFEGNEDVEQIMVLVLDAIEVRKKFLLHLQEVGMIQGTVDYGSLSITPEDRRN